MVKPRCGVRVKLTTAPWACIRPSHQPRRDVMSRQPRASGGKALIDRGRQLSVQMDDLLTVDGEEIAWGAVKDFNAPINGVLVSFHKGEPIRDRHLINALCDGRCPVASLASELSQRITLAVGEACGVQFPSNVLDPWRALLRGVPPDWTRRWRSIFWPAAVWNCPGWAAGWSSSPPSAACRPR